MNNILVSGLETFKIYYSKKYNKVVYLMGEIHDKKLCTGESSMKASDFFFNLIQSTNKFLDIYLETAFNPAEQQIYKRTIQMYIYKLRPPEGLGFLTDTLARLAAENCGFDVLARSLKEKLQCKYRNIRFHSSDVRLTRTPVLEFFHDLLRYSEYCIGRHEVSLEKAECDTIITQINNYEMEKFSKDIEKIALDTKIARQLSKVQYIEVKTKLIKVYVEKFKKFELLFSKDTPTGKLYIQEFLQKYGYRSYENLLEQKMFLEFSKHFVKSIDQTSKMNDVDKQLNEINQFEETLYFISILMDVYLLARMFRNFKEDNSPDGLPVDQKNIIIYAGNFHIKNYCDILEELDFTEVYKAQRVHDNCIKIENFQPMWL